MYIRGYSSPFSWMNIDLESALHFIKIGFEGFTDVIRLTDKINQNGVYEYTNHIYPVHNWDKLCYWTHHDLSDNIVIQALKRRADRLIYHVNSPNTLLLYFDTLMQPIEHYRSIVDPFTAEYRCKILIIGPGTIPTSLIYQSDSLSIISVEPGGSKIRILLNYLFTFNIIPLPTSRPDASDSTHLTQ
jgi:hypothetical protein